MSQSREDAPQELPPLKRKSPQLALSAGRHSAQERGNDLWLLTLSDLLLLLMVFFVILFGLAFQQKNAGSHSPIPQAKARVILEEIRPEAEERPPEKMEPEGRLASFENTLRLTLADKDRDRQVVITRRADSLFLIFPETIVFDPGQARLKPSARPILEKVASLASSHPYLLVEVQGHTDNKPIHNKRYASNWELSADRATQVVKALIGLGLNPIQISGRGFGEYRALYPNDSDSKRDKNRRVEIQFSLAPSS